MITGRPGKTARRRWARGFTLLELVLVMVIIGTVLGMAAPSLRGFFLSRRTQDAAARLAALTRLARSLAVSNGLRYRLVLGDDQGLICLTREASGGFERIGTGLARPIVLPEGVELSLQVAGAPPGRNYVGFFPDGRSEPAKVTLRDVKGGTAVLVCRAPAESFELVERPKEEL